MRRPRPDAGLLAAAALTAGAVVFGASLRLDQLPWHSNVWGIDWLGYFEPQARHLRHGNVFGWLLSWEGLHPPISGAIHGFFQAISVSFVTHWVLTVAAGLAAVVVLGGVGWRETGSVAALLIPVAVLSGAPMQANYGLNTSPYPWALLATSLSTWAMLAALRAGTGDDDAAKAAWRRSAWASALAAQVNILVTAAVLGQILFLLLLHRRLRKRWTIIVGVSLAFIVGMSLFKTTDPWTFHISEEEPWPSTARHMLTSRFVAIGDCWGMVAWVAAGCVAGLLSEARRAVGLLLLQALGYVAALALFYEIHVADPRLTHYYLVPQLLLVAAGGWGLAAGAARFGPRAGPAAALILAAAASATWGGAAADWYDRKAAAADERIAASSADELRPYWADAKDGDVVLYLWDHSFLNDEPEHMDPIAARWPTGRTGRPCYDDPDPRLLCNRDGGAHFYFSPNLLSREEFASFEETFRIVLNMVEAPGRAVVIAAPNLGETAPRPWPWEAWLEGLGGVAKGPFAGDVMVWEMPAGLVVPGPPPIDPEG